MNDQICVVGPFKFSVRQVAYTDPDNWDVVSTPTGLSPGRTGLEPIQTRSDEIKAHTSTAKKTFEFWNLEEKCVSCCPTEQLYRRGRRASNSCRKPSSRSHPSFLEVQCSVIFRVAPASVDVPTRIWCGHKCAVTHDTIQFMPARRIRS